MLLPFNAVYYCSTVLDMNNIHNANVIWSTERSRNVKHELTSFCYNTWIPCWQLTTICWKMNKESWVFLLCSEMILWRIISSWAYPMSIPLPAGWEAKPGGRAGCDALALGCSSEAHWQETSHSETPLFFLPGNDPTAKCPHCQRLMVLFTPVYQSWQTSISWTKLVINYTWILPLMSESLSECLFHTHNTMMTFLLILVIARLSPKLENEVRHFEKCMW